MTTTTMTVSTVSKATRQHGQGTRPEKETAPAAGPETLDATSEADADSAVESHSCTIFSCAACTQLFRSVDAHSSESAEAHKQKVRVCVLISDSLLVKFSFCLARISGWLRDCICVDSCVLSSIWRLVAAVYAVIQTAKGSRPKQKDNSLVG